MPATATVTGSRTGAIDQAIPVAGMARSYREEHALRRGQLLHRTRRQAPPAAARWAATSASFSFHVPSMKASVRR